MALDDLGADALASDQLLLGAQQIREPVVEVLDLVEHGELGGGVCQGPECAERGLGKQLRISAVPGPTGPTVE